MGTVLLVDISYLSYRSYHSTGRLSYEGEPTGVMFGVLRDVDAMIEMFGATQCVMAFDSGGPGLRGQILPTYKGNRDAGKTEEEIEAKEQLYIQITKLRTKVFPALGFRNIFKCRGYEADDIIAYCADRIRGDDEAVIITSDEDLFQCLRNNVRWYSPGSKRLVTSASFAEEWGIDPCQWPDVKAFAGCSTDNVPGIDGIGEKTAAKWFRGQLKPTSKAYQLISANIQVHLQNIKLVRLPFPGIEVPALVPDELTNERRIRVHQELGIRANRRPRAAQSGPKGFDL